MKKKILCTLGPASMNEHSIRRLEELGVDLFRINLSHTKLEDVPGVISYITKKTHIPLCIDTEGAQIRNGEIKNGSVKLNEHNLIKVVRKKIIGDETQFNLYPDYIIDKLQREDFISVDFDSILLQVIEIDEKLLTMRVINGGEMGQNKAVTLNRPFKMPPLTDKDKNAIKIAREMGVNHFALSFANFPEDVDLIRSHSGKEAFIISKIECRNGVKNLKEITKKSDAILIDRGDLSREFPIERIPSLQKRIIAHCNSDNTEVYVATNLLETMIRSGTPTRAEVNDVYTTLKDGANGLVLAAETAIGSNPVACVNMIVKLIYSFETDLRTEKLGFYLDSPKSLLLEPHGGHLVNNFSEDSSLKVEGLPKLKIRNTDLMDCEMIANGTFSPISGFMEEKALKSVLESNCLPNGLIWTMPLILQVQPQESLKMKIGDRVALCDDLGKTYSILDITELYNIDLPYVAEKWFGTNAENHPGVSNLMDRGECCIAGSLTMLQKYSTTQDYFHFSPNDTRFIFDHKGWNKVIGFQTRSPALKIHEFIQLSSMENTFADGIFISSLVGPKNTDDFLSKTVLESYRLLIENGIFPEGKVILGSSLSYPRFCNTREIVFEMLCKKNMGCSHLVIGNDHLTSIEDCTLPKETKRFLDTIGNIGITPIYLDEILDSNNYTNDLEVRNIKNRNLLNSSELRTAILKGKFIPESHIRGFVQDALRNSLNKDAEFFQ